MNNEQKAKDYITEALLQLMEKNDYQDISITDITKKAGVNRVTFYRNFNNKDEESKAYAVINKNREELKGSSSGGVFYILAKHIIENKGIVFGVTYNENMKVIHKYAETLEECKIFCGSKYVRSDLENTYQEAERFLKEGRMV